MSFLLDALRKSEHRKHQRDVPTIHSRQAVEAAPAEKRRMGPLILVLLPTFLVLIWFGNRQFGGEGQTGQTPPEVSSPPAPIAGQQADREMTGDTAVVPSGPRTPVEEYSGPIAPAAEQLPAEPTVTESAPAEAVLQPPIEEPEAPVSAAPGNDPEPYTPPRPGEISYWELPESVREELPEFRISVLVFAREPEDRFILLNGQRQLEGGEYRSGLVLQEIRREGAVFSYRHYRFLVRQ